MSKVAQYLQEHVNGEVMTSEDAREYFATDGSIFKLVPQIVLYPRTENDIRKSTRFAWQLAERGRKMSITARGSGTDLGGAAIGSGLVIVFPAHMNKILALDSGRGTVTIQPGINYGKLQQTLHTHALFLPPFPASLEYSTVGGAIANNAGGEKSVKYGTTKDYVRNLRLVLSNGEVLITGRVNKKELNKKKGLPTFEGEIYRAIDGLLTDNADLLDSFGVNTSKNSAGYNLWDIKRKDGSFDLTPLIVGSQGTLGIVSEATLETEVHNPLKTLIVSKFNTITDACRAVDALNKLDPSALELVDDKLLNFLDKHNPNQLKGILDPPYPKIVLLTEFDDVANRIQAKKSRKASKLLKKMSIEHFVSTDLHEQEDYWKIRHSAAAVIWQNIGSKKSLPIIEDGIVPVQKLEEFIKNIYKIFNDFELEVAVWGHAGNANLHVQPFIDLGQVGDRQKAYKLIDAYYRMIIDMGGSTSAQHNDGRLRAPYLPLMYGSEIYNIFTKVKQVFDPYDILNPGVKTGVHLKDIQQITRTEYSIKHLYDHMPRT